MDASYGVRVAGKSNRHGFDRQSILPPNEPVKLGIFSVVELVGEAGFALFGILAG
jgi:hypothetical protein